MIDQYEIQRRVILPPGNVRNSAAIHGINTGWQKSSLYDELERATSSLRRLTRLDSGHEYRLIRRTIETIVKEEVIG